MSNDERARPLFPGMFLNPQNAIRGYYDRACCGLRPGGGPNVPDHWLDGAGGWTTRHFYDVESYRYEGSLGVHKCKQCGFEVTGQEMGCGPCKAPIGNAPSDMEEHLKEAHGMSEPPQRKWASGCCDCTGCCNAYLCFFCQASRQVMSFHGWADQCNCCWCMIFCCSTFSFKNKKGKVIARVVSYQVAAFITRMGIRQLNDVDEHCCCTLCAAFCCPFCSMCQTYREYSAAGVWPGGCCNGSAPPEIAMDLPPAGVTPGKVCGPHESNDGEGSANEPIADAAKLPSGIPA